MVIEAVPLVIALALAPTGGPKPCEALVARSHLKEGDYVSAEACASEIARTRPTPPAPGSLLALDAIARVYLATGRGGSAEALVWARKGYSGLSSNAPVSVRSAQARNLGLVLLEGGYWDESPLALFEEALDLAESSQDAGRQLEAQIDLGEGLSRLGRVEDAISRLGKARQLAMKRGDELARARIEEIVARCQQDLGKYGEMRQSLEVAREIRERLQPDHPETAAVLGLMGDLLVLEGSNERASYLYARTVRLLENRLGPESPRLAHWLGKLAAAQAAEGDLPTAIRTHERALVLSATHLGTLHPETFGRFNDLANALLDAGDFVGANEYYELALRGASKMAEPNRTLYMATLRFNLADAGLRSGDLEPALEHARGAIELWRSHFSPGHQFVALGLEMLAEIQRRRGRTTDARTVLTQAVEIRLAAQGEQDPATGRAATHLGELALATGDVKTAREMKSIAATALRASRRIYPVDTGRMLLLDARLESRDGNTAGALHKAIEADTLGRDYLLRTVSYLSESQAQRVVRERTPALDLALSLDWKAIGDEDRLQVFDGVVRSRGLVLGAIAERARSLGQPGARTRAHQRMERAGQHLASLLYRGPTSSLAEHARLVLNAEAEWDQAERAYSLENSEFGSRLESERAGAKEVLSAIPKSTSLVSLVRYRAVESSETVEKEAYVAFVAHSGDSVPALVRLGPATAFDAAIRRWDQAASDIQGAMLGREAEVAYRQAASDLVVLLWEPIRPYLKGTRLFLVADGIAQTLDLAVLPVKGSQCSPSSDQDRTCYLAETGLEVHYLAAERDLVSYSSLHVATGPLLAIGAPHFDSLPKLAGAGAGESPRSGVDQGHPAGDRFNRIAWRGGGSKAASCGALAEMMFVHLPGADLEVRDLATLWQDRTGLPATILTGADASTARFSELAPRFRVLHLATHGFLWEEGCVIGGGESLASPPIMDNPMFLAGLAFAGANVRDRATDGEDDGILTADEISRLYLSSAEWVVLSACDSGGGRIQLDDGLLGLRRAFQIAGAKTVIGSLWPVDDELTREWMRKLYESRLEEGLDTPASVHAANIALLERLHRDGPSTHPALWGGFVSFGSWR